MFFHSLLKLPEFFVKRKRELSIKDKRVHSKYIIVILLTFLA